MRRSRRPRRDVDGPRILVPGEPVADAPLVDQQGKPRPFSSFKGHRVAITFIYTRCPLPGVLSADGSAVRRRYRRRSRARTDLRDVRLVSITLDPEFDTPAVLSRHAERLKADPDVWTFLTGEPADGHDSSHSSSGSLPRRTSEPAPT